MSLLVGCEGPQGTEGPQGEQGLQGPKGDQGPQGEEGTANVIYSDWVTPDTWKPAKFFGDSVRYGDLLAPDLTQEIVDNGEVSVYIDVANPNVESVYKLPITPNMAGFNFTVNFKIKPDTVRVVKFDPNNPSTDPGGLNSSNEFCYVLIPGGQAAGSSANTTGNLLKEMSYQELKQRFDIPDKGSGVIRDVTLK